MGQSLDALIKRLPPATQAAIRSRSEALAREMLKQAHGLGSPHPGREWLRSTRPSLAALFWTER